VVEYGPEGRIRAWSYGQLYGAACAFAGRLHGELGIQPGGRVVLSGPNSGGWVAACLGIHMAGLTVVPLDTEYGGSDRANIMAFVDASAVVCSAGLRDKFMFDLPLIELESVAPLETGCESPHTELAEGQPFSIVFTSGSTATPKGVMLSEENFLHNVNVLRARGKLITRADVLLNLLPLHHVYAFTTTLLLNICVGSTVVYPASLKPADIAAAAAGENATIMAVVPQVLTAVHNRVVQQVKSSALLKQVLFSLMTAIGRIGIERGWRPGRLLFGSLAAAPGWTRKSTARWHRWASGLSRPTASAKPRRC
jgi:long-chain acyl-CoA synthetase